MPNLKNSTSETAPLPTGTLLPQMSLRECIRRATKELEGTIILRTLEEHRWNRRRAAEALNISYRSLMYKMKRCNVRNSGPATPGEVD